MTNPAAIFGADNAATLLQNTLVTQDGQDISSGRSRNFIRNRSGYRNTNGWVATGTATVIRTTTPAEVVDGVASLKFGGGAVNDFIKYAFTINNAQKNGSVSISFDYIFQSGISGDFLVEVFDVTAAALAYTNSQGFSGFGTFSGYFLASANADYELRLTRKAGAGTFSAANFDVYKGQRTIVSADTSWVAFTPTLENLGSISFVECFKRKNGPDLLLDLRFVMGVANVGTTASIILPDSLVTGTSAGSGHTCGTWERNNSTNGTPKGGVMIAASGFTKIFFGQKETNAAVSPFTTQQADIFANNTLFSVQVRVPINGWELSTFSANNALTQYASNTNATSAATDTASFYNGIDGALVPTFAAVLGSPFSINRLVQFPTALSPSEPTPVLEFQIGGAGPWLPHTMVTEFYASSVTEANTGNRWGVGCRNTNNTQIEVAFGRAGSIIGVIGSSTTVGTAYPRIAGDRWRVRRVLNGGDALLPISAANIIGQTTAPAAGFVGEEKTATAANTNVAASNTFQSVAQILLTSGNWLIVGATGVGLGTSTGLVRLIAALSTNSSAPDSSAGGALIELATSTAINNRVIATRKFFVPAGTTQIIYLLAVTTYSTAGTAQITSDSALTATRIA